MNKPRPLLACSPHVGQANYQIARSNILAQGAAKQRKQSSQFHTMKNQYIHDL